MSFFSNTISFPPLVGKMIKNSAHTRTREYPAMAVQSSSILVQTDETGNSSDSNKNLLSNSCTKSQTPNPILGQANTVGIIGGVSAFSTLIFLEKLVSWSSRNGEGSVPFVVHSDPNIHKQISISSPETQNESNCDPIVENLRRKREFLENSGARCIIMPCHVCHVWHGEVSEGSSMPFLHVGECVAEELKEAKLKPIEAGSSVRIGVLATSKTLKAGFYQEKLQNQGFEVVLPEKATMEHIVIPSMEALRRKDMEGARNLLRIAIQVLLVRAVNVVMLASDEMQGLLPRDDPLLKRCIDPMDALARSAIKWAKANKNAAP